jgi:hypothetical protein
MQQPVEIVQIKADRSHQAENKTPLSRWEKLYRRSGDRSMRSFVRTAVYSTFRDGSNPEFVRAVEFRHDLMARVRANMGRDLHSRRLAELAQALLSPYLTGESRDVIIVTDRRTPDLTMALYTVSYIYILARHGPV